MVGVALIRRGERVWHHRVMLLATALAALFLVFYLAKWGLYGTTAYGGRRPGGGLLPPPLYPHPPRRPERSPGPLRHLARPSGEFALHRRWARILVPVWLYVALSGWVIYLVLKRYGVERGGIAF